jgi:hypothetical protein
VGVIDCTGGFFVAEPMFSFLKLQIRGFGPLSTLEILSLFWGWRFETCLRGLQPSCSYVSGSIRNRKLSCFRGVSNVHCLGNRSLKKWISGIFEFAEVSVRIAEGADDTPAVLLHVNLNAALA